MSYMKQTVVYDIETIPEITPKIGYNSFAERQRMTVGVTYNQYDQMYKVWYEAQANELIEYLSKFDQIVGFAIKSFDNVVLNSYKPGILEQLNKKSIDMLEILEGRLGHLISLDNVASPTLNLEKTGDGQKAIEWWKNGDKDKVVEYCKEDVRITKELYEYGLKKREVAINYYGQIRTVKIDWTLQKKYSARDFSYTLVDEHTNETITIDPDNEKFFQALDLVLKTRQTIYLTGKAGTGKTTFLKYLKNNVDKNIVVLAYTGVAAINAGGQTIHSFFQINPTSPPFLPDDRRLRLPVRGEENQEEHIYNTFKYRKPKRDLIESIELLIIDEVSMVRADMLDTIDKILRAFRKNGKGKPFGGVQLMLIGDTFQLAPIEDQSWQILRQFYDGPHFFNSLVLKQNPPLYIELDKIYRQSEHDFIELLNRVRVNQVSESDLQILNRKHRPITQELFEENYIVLCSLNSQVSNINNDRINEITGNEKTYTGIIEDEFPRPNAITEVNLKLKEGAQVMFLKNGRDYYNGKIGTIEELHDNMILASTTNSLGEKKVFEVERAEWYHMEYTYNRDLNKIEQKVLGKYIQYPLKLAWAITVHKSQGLTFDKVVINLSNFTPHGLAYVALSRCTNMNGLVLGTPIYRNYIKTDQRVLEFAENETPSTLIVDLIHEGQADSLYKESKTLYNSNKFDEAFDTFIKALKYRNDIETDDLRQFFKIEYFRKNYYREEITLVQEKIAEYKDKHNSLSIELQKLETEKQKIESEKNELKTEMEILSQKNNDQYEKLTEIQETSEKCQASLNNYTERLKNTRNKLRSQVKKISEQDNEIETLKKTLKERDKTIKTTQTALDDTKIELSKVRAENHGLKKEVQRLNNLSWFDKLLGK